MLLLLRGRGPCARLGRRLLSSSSTSSVAITFAEQGAPGAVLRKETVQVAAPGAGQVLLRMLAAPVGAFCLPAVAGHMKGVGGSGVAGFEGVGVVESVGSGVSGLKEGDTVIPGMPGFGTWRERAVAGEKELLVIPSGVAAEENATVLGASAAVALRVLEDVGGALKSGDCVLVDGANGSVGIPLVQIAKAKGLKVVSVVGKGAFDFAEVEKMLKELGSDAVVEESLASSSSFRKVAEEMKPKLAVHTASSVDSSTALARSLAQGGILVAVPGSGPVTVPAMCLIDKKITIRGFHLDDALKAKGGPCETLDELVKLIKDGKLKSAKSTTEKISNFEAAVLNASRETGLVFKF